MFTMLFYEKMFNYILYNFVKFLAMSIFLNYTKFYYMYYNRLIKRQQNINVSSF